MQGENYQKCTSEILYALGNLITECQVEKLYKCLIVDDPQQILVQEVIVLATKLLEQNISDRNLVPLVIEMLNQLLDIGGLQAKNFLQECGGEELIDNLTQSTNQRIRKVSSDFADKFFKGSLNDGITSDIFFQQDYHARAADKYPIKTDEERYYNDEDENRSDEQHPDDEEEGKCDDM